MQNIKKEHLLPPKEFEFNIGSVFIGRVAPPPSTLLFTLRASGAEVVNIVNAFPDKSHGMRDGLV